MQISAHRSWWPSRRVVISLLELSEVQKPKLGLDDVKLFIRFQRISRLGQRWRVHHQKVGVGGLHPWLVVGQAHLTLHEVLHQHPHELILRGQQLLDAHGRWRWWWWWGRGGSPTRSRGPSLRTGSR
jgi:hypothetical protein